LRERREDITVLVEYFLRKYAKGQDVAIADDALDHLKERSWKGNVRELENSIARACILSDYSIIKLAHLKDQGSAGQREVRLTSVRDMEMNLIVDTLKTMNGNRTQAAVLLGITVRTLRNKIKEYKGLGIAVPQGAA
jgi:DNA-binding NtrC family response regulator